MKKILIVVMSLTLVFGSCGLALADNEVDIDQTGIGSAECPSITTKLFRLVAGARRMGK